MLCKSALTVQIALKRYGLDALLPLIERYYWEGIGTERREIRIGGTEWREKHGTRWAAAVSRDSTQSDLRPDRNQVCDGPLPLTLIVIGPAKWYLSSKAV